MRRRLALVAPLGVAWLGLAMAMPAGAVPVAVEVSTLAGARLGRLDGAQQGGIAYFPLADVVRLVGARTRRWPGGARVSVISRHGVLEVERDAAHAVLGGRRIPLAAPVRVWRGAWHMPGDLLLRAVPALLGAGVRITAAGGPALRPAGPGSSRLPARPAVAPPPRGAEPVAIAPAAVGAPETVTRPPAPPAGPEAVLPARRTPGPSDRRDLAVVAVELRYRSYPTYTRIVVETARPVEPRVVETAAGLTVVFPGVSPRGWHEHRSVRDGLVGTVELGEARGAAALVVGFEQAPAGRTVFRLEDPARLVVDVQRRTPVARSAGGGPEPIRTVVLDPGHGGHDAGAIGPTGLQEKELTLDVARRVAAVLEEDLGVRVILTRTRDQFLALRERTALANREKADLFVSIHANAAPAPAAAGTETYFLSSEATDGAARRAAEDENRVLALEGEGRAGGRDVLRSILWDLAQSDFQQESSRAAEAIQTQLDRALRLPSRGVKQAPFYVLGGAAMPAVLVEIGFLSNPEEERRLRDDGYRERIARALAAGLAAYKRGYERRLGVAVRR